MEICTMYFVHSHTLMIYEKRRATDFIYEIIESLKPPKTITSDKNNQDNASFPSHFMAEFLQISLSLSWCVALSLFTGNKNCIGIQKKTKGE